MPLAARSLITAQHLADQFRVERAGRLVEQHQPRLQRQRPGDGDPLLLAAGQLPRVGAFPAGQPDPLEQFAGRRGGLPCAARRAATGPSIMFSSTVMCGNRLNCWNTMPMRARCRVTCRCRSSCSRPPSSAVVPVADELAVDLDEPGVRLLQVVDAAQQRALARAGRPEQHGHLAPRTSRSMPSSTGAGRSSCAARGSAPRQRLRRCTGALMPAPPGRYGVRPKTGRLPRAICHSPRPGPVTALAAGVVALDVVLADREQRGQDDVPEGGHQQQRHDQEVRL